MRTLYILAMLSFCLLGEAQVSKTIDVPTAGTLSTLLTSSEKTTVTNLTVTGIIDARDVKCMRDEMSVLAVLDINAVTIQAYNGNGGTYTDTSYPANEMPEYSFSKNDYYNGPYIGKSTLRNITFPSSITSIGDGAFLNCYGLTNITIGSGVISIGSNAFYWCTGLKIITSLNPTPPTVVGTLAFFNVKPAIVYVPATAVTAYKTASGWSAYTIATEKRITMNNPTAGGLAAALLNAGYGPLSSISHLTVTGNLNSVDIGQMNTNMTILTEIDLSGTAIDNNTLPANAFQNKTTLTSIKLPSTIATIGDYAFSGCTSVSGRILLPSALNSIGQYAFSGCSSLSGDLIIPNTITSIGAFAFNGCSGFTGSLTIPNTVTSIGNSVFYGCIGFTGSLTIPNTVTSIGNSVFYGCIGFTGSLTIPNSVTSIGTNAFQNCNGLSGTLTLPNAISFVSASAFSGCKGLSGILTIPLLITSIGTSAFSGCNQLTELIISKNTTSIGDNAFLNCTGLTKISVPRSAPPTIYANTFGGINKETCTLEIPTGSSATYQAANYWSLFIFFTEKDFSSAVSTIVDEKIRIYPNPMTEGFRINGLNGKTTIRLWDINGKVFFVKSVVNDEYISINFIPKGVYVIELTTNEEIITRRIIKI
jgi:hypothetical protein